MTKMSDNEWLALITEGKEALEYMAPKLTADDRIVLLQFINDRREECNTLHDVFNMVYDAVYMCTKWAMGYGKDDNG